MPTRTCALLLAAGLFWATAAHAQQPAPAATRASQPKMVLVPYQVADLVIPLGEKGAKTDEERLMKLIQDTVAPRSWAAMGGQGTIDYFPITMTLVVNQTPDVQEQVADLLARLRHEQDTEVCLEVRVISVPECFFERLGVSAEDMKHLTSKGVFLSDKVVARLLEAVQGEQRANVLQSPKITMLNGQVGCVDCTDKQSFVTGAEVVHRDGKPILVPKTEEVVTGLRMSACPRVSADRRYVLLNLELDKADLASAVVPSTPVTMEVKDDQGTPHTLVQDLQRPQVNTLRFDTHLTIPDGGTVLIGGLKQVTEGRAEFGPPVLTKIPYTNRLFKNVGTVRETQNVYVLVTPRVIVNEAEEQRQSGHAEESEPYPSPCCGPNKALAELLKAYDAACAAGHKDEAAKFAQAALILDPTCFASKHGR
jgi:type II secretory pathway component GspD/PulD (secretin)